MGNQPEISVLTDCFIGSNAVLNGMVAKTYFVCSRTLSAVELLPIIGKLHPSEHYYAKQQTDHIMNQVFFTP